MTKLFASLDRLEEILDGKNYLIGNQLTEADVRLFVTIVSLEMLLPRKNLRHVLTISPDQIRFDVAYFTVFKCNIRTIRDGYPNIHM